mgnify:CR=1 FL=1
MFNVSDLTATNTGTPPRSTIALAEEEKVKEIFDKWDLNCEKIGNVTENDELNFYQYGEKVAQVPPSSLVLGGGAPIYERDYSEPSYYKEYNKFNINDIE